MPVRKIERQCNEVSDYASVFDAIEINDGKSARIKVRLKSVHRNYDWDDLHTTGTFLRGGLEPVYIRELVKREIPRILYRMRQPSATVRDKHVYKCAVCDILLKYFSLSKQEIQGVPPHRIVIRLSHHAHDSAQRSIISKKSIFYADKVFFDLDYELKFTRILDMWRPEVHVDAPFELVQAVYDAVDAIDSKCLFVLPRRIERQWIRPWTLPSEKSIDETSNIISVKFAEQYLIQQLTESRSVRLFLPHLHGISFDDIVSIKIDYQDHADRFQRALSRILATNELTGDAALYALMQETDCHIRKLNEAMKDLARRGWFTKAGGVLVLFPLILLLPNSTHYDALLQSIIGALGAGTAMSFWQSQIDQVKLTRTAEQDPFFIAWRAHSDFSDRRKMRK